MRCDERMRGGSEQMIDFATERQQSSGVLLCCLTELLCLVGANRERSSASRRRFAVGVLVCMAARLCRGAGNVRVHACDILLQVQGTYVSSVLRNAMAGMAPLARY